MKKTSKITAAVLTAAVTAATVCAAVPTAGAQAQSGARTAVIYYRTDNPKKAAEWQKFTAHVGDTLQITVSAQTADPDYPLFCNAQNRVLFNRNEQGKPTYQMLEFCDDYYDPANRIVTQVTDFPNMSSMVNMQSSKGLPGIVFRSGNKLCYNISGVTTLMDFSEPTVLYRFAVEVKSPGITYLTTVNEMADNVEPSEEPAGWDFHNLKENSAVLSTDIAVVRYSDPDTAYRVIFGDCNSDGQLDIQDITLLQRYLSEEISLRFIYLYHANVDGEGGLTIKDVSVLQTWLTLE